MVRKILSVLLSSSLLLGCPPEQPKSTEPPLGSETYADFKECKRTSPSYRDSKPTGFELRIGSGFSDHPNDLRIFKAAAKNWSEKTGLALAVTEGHGLKGKIHVHDKLSLCGSGKERTDPNWKHADPKSWNEYVYGCYMSRPDEITLSRAAIRKLADNLASDAGSDASSQELYNKLFFWTSMHEIGHWLGLSGHAGRDSGAVMADGGPMQAVMGSGRVNRITVVERRLVCLKNDCGDDWCSKIKEP